MDTDALLKKEVVTLAEALRSAHIAVLLAINSISVLMSVSSLICVSGSTICNYKIAVIALKFTGYASKTY